MRHNKDGSTTLAVLTIYDAAAMTWRQRQAVYRWLAKQACAVVDEGENYAPRMRARYLVTAKGGGK